MTNDVKTDVVEPQTNEPDAQTTANVEEQQEQKTFDAAYVKQLRDEAAQNRIKLKKLEQEKEQETAKALQEQGKFQELYEKRDNELTALKVQFEQIEQKAKMYDEMVEKEKKKLVSQLPKEMQKDFADLDLDKLSKIVESFLKKDSILAAEQQSTKPKGATTLEESILKHYGGL